MEQLFNLKDKTILITGASSGIGQACAILCSRLGAKVALVGRNEERLQQNLDQLDGDGHCYFVADLAEVAEIEALVKLAVTSMGAFDGFVHSAGISINRPLKLLKPEQHMEIYAINVLAAFEIARNLLRKDYFSTNGFSAVFIASVMSVISEKAKIAYCASKAALVHGAKVIALEYASKGVRVNSVSPGMVRTEMLSRLSERVGEESWVKIAQAHPLGIGEPIDVANAICFLLSDQARWITGSNLVIDGGYSCS